jgi:hypothetical protein
MNATKTLLVAALAAAGLVATTAADAQSRGGHGGSNASGRSHAGSSGNWSGRGGGNFSRGAHGGHWNGRSAGYGRGWGGGYRGGYRGSYWGPRFGFAFGVPLFLGSAYYWGSPYYYDDYPRNALVYRERIEEPYPAAIPDEDMTTEVEPSSEGAPTQGPTYMNYCESSRAYYPKVTQCPEGWKFVPSR